MYPIRSIVYAEAQARIRARVGSMPDANAWRGLATETDLDQLIEHMRSQGLWYWVAGLPRQPDTASIEIHLQGRLLDRAAALAAWLPPPWAPVQAWIRIGLGLFLVRSVLIDRAVVLPDNADEVLRRAAGVPPEQRAAALATSAYARYIAPGAAGNTWLGEFDTRLPRMSRREAAALRRIVGLAREYASRLSALRRQAREDAAAIDSHAQWRLQYELGTRLRQSSAGDPFHAGLILSYGILEWLQFQRCRALLIARAQHWQAPDVTGGAS